MHLHGTGLRGLPQPATGTSPHDAITATHAHSSAQTHTQVWELRKWARAEPLLEGLVHRPRKGSTENCRLQQAGGVHATGRMGSHAS